MADPGTEPPKGEEEPLDHGYKAPRAVVRKGKDWNLALIIRIVLFFGLVAALVFRAAIRKLHVQGG